MFNLIKRRWSFPNQFTSVTAEAFCFECKIRFDAIIKTLQEGKQHLEECELKMVSKKK